MSRLKRPNVIHGYVSKTYLLFSLLLPSPSTSTQKEGLHFFMISPQHTPRNQITSISTMAPTNKPAKVMVDMVYGLNPNSTTGGCVVQRSFEESLLASGGIASIRVHVASSLPSAEKVVRRLQEEDNGGETAYSRVLIIDGIALLFLREKLEVLKRSLGKRGGASSQRVMVGFVHCPFRYGVHDHCVCFFLACRERLATSLELCF